MDEIKNYISKFKTKSLYGFSSKELEKVLEDFPNINKDKFENAFGVHTVMVQNGETIHYFSDVELALRCGLENRNPTIYEFD